MPQDPAYMDLEMDAVEERGAGRVPQETPRSAVGGGLNPHPEGLAPRLVKHKKGKTLKATGAEITQVTRREREM